MRAGKLRHTVIIQSATEALDGFGEAVKTWAEYAKARASVEPLQGREFYAAQQFNSEVKVKIRMRFLDGVTPKMRISFNSKIYNIQSIVDPQERNNEMHLMCSEGVNDG